MFDTNKNGKLEFQEAVSALCVLCGGSMQSKIKYLLGAYSERGGTTIKMKNLKKFIECVLRLALNSTNEIMLNYPVPELAKATAKKCMDVSGVGEQEEISLEQVMTFIESATPIAIFKNKK